METENVGQVTKLGAEVLYTPNPLPRVFPLE